MTHDLSGFAMKEAVQETCSYTFAAVANNIDSLKANGLTEADLSDMSKMGEWGVLKGKIAQGQIPHGQKLFTGLSSLDQLVVVHWNEELFKLQLKFPGSAAQDLFKDLTTFEDLWLKSKGYEWTLGKATKKMDVSPNSTSVGALTDEDAAALFVQTKDALAKEKGILDLKGKNKQLDTEVYESIGQQTGYTGLEVKAKVDAYKASGKKLSALKKKVLKKEKNVPKPNGVPIAATKESVNEAVEKVAAKMEANPGTLYQDEDIVSAYIKAKDDIAALPINDWTLYTQTDDFEAAIFKRMREHYGLEVTDTGIKNAIARYVGGGKKISALKKKLANSKTDSWVPKADTLKSKASSFHITTPTHVPTGPSITPSSLADILGTEFDISGMAASGKDEIYAAFKKESGTYLTSEPGQIYEAALKIAKKYGNDLDPNHFNKSDVLSVLKIIDERGALKFGVTNEHLFEKKLVEWLQTSAGKTYFKTKAEAEYWINQQPALPADSSLFQVISSSEANAMQRDMGTWTASSRGGLRTYTGGSYREMNDYLRGKSRHISSYLKTAITNAKAGMKRTTRNFLVHRGTSLEQFGVNSIEELYRMVGLTVTDEGFVSTSVGGRAAFSSNPVIMEIQVPRGAKGAYINDISHFKNIEYEFLLAPGTKFKILRVTKDGYQTTVHCRVEI